MWAKEIYSIDFVVSSKKEREEKEGRKAGWKEGKKEGSIISGNNFNVSQNNASINYIYQITE